MLSNCGAGEDSWESLWLQGDQTNQSLRYRPWIFIRTDVESEAPILWPSHKKSWLAGKDLDSRKNWGEEKKRATEDEMIWCHHLFNWQEFEQTPGDSERQGCLACCSPWSFKESDRNYRLNNSIYFLSLYIFYWSIFDFQCFRCTASWFSYTCTHILFFRFFFFFHYSLWKDKGYSSLCCCCCCCCCCC